MAKLTKKERLKIELQMAPAPTRGATWVGTRPVVFKSKKHDIKTMRRESRRLCATY